jgi:hypothetical protein
MSLPARLAWGMIQSGNRKERGRKKETQSMEQMSEEQKVWATWQSTNTAEISFSSG